MTDLKRIGNLAVVGMDITFPGGDGLAAFGRLVYRGVPMEGRIDGGASFETMVERTVQGALQDARLTGDRVAVITLSPDTEAIAQTNLVQSVIHDRSGAPNPLMAALEAAHELLATGLAGDVVLLDSQAESQIVSAVVLSLRSCATQDQRRVYAEILYPSGESYLPVGSAAGSAHRAVLAGASITPEMVGLIVTAALTSSGIQPEEGAALRSAYHGSGEPTCALTGGTGGLAGLVKAAWCLYQRVIPGTPGWVGADPSEDWQQSAFYVPEKSRTWFSSSIQKTRYAVFRAAAPDGSISPLLLKESVSRDTHTTEAVKEEPFYLFPVAAENIRQLSEKITDLKDQVSLTPDMAGASRHCFDQFMLDRAAARFQVCLLAHTAAELSREIGFAGAGIPAAYEKGADWQTPLGSYFTSRPLGEEGGVAFVYPGAFNSYPGVGQDLFYLFPGLHDRFNRLSQRVDELLYEKMLYPRSLQPLSPAELNQLEARLTADPVAMLISGSSLAVLYTFLLKDVFGIQASSAFGYSLGEISMMFAGNVWTAADEISATLRSSDLFQTRLAGPQHAVRRHWKMPADVEEDRAGAIWENYLLMTTAEKVLAVISPEPRVYLTHINTPRQVVIGGDPAGCQRVIQTLKCSSLKAPFNYALHSAAISSEHEGMLKLLTWPVNQQPGMALYSAATRHPMQIDSAATARQLAGVLCTPLDFPALIQNVYQDGARLFIELGAGSNCARWIDETLQGQPHGAFSIDRKGVDDYTSILRLLARLVCHRVPVNLESLYK